MHAAAPSSAYCISDLWLLAY